MTKPEQAAGALERLLAISSVASITTTVVAIARSKVTAKFLGPVGVGSSAEVLQLVGMLMVPLTFATGPALVAAVARANDAEGLPAGRRAISTALKFTLATGLAAGVLATLFGALTFPGDTAQVTWWLILGSMQGVLSATSSVWTTALVARSRLLDNGIVTVGQSILLAVLSAAGTIAGGLDGQFLGAAVGALGGVLLARWRARTKLPELTKGSDHFDRTFLRQALIIGATSFYASAIAQGLWSMLRYMVHTQSGAEGNGQLQAARAVGVAYFGLFLQGLGTVIFPRFASAKNNVELENEIQSSLALIFRFAPPFIALAICLRTFVMHLLYSDAFDEAAQAVGYLMASDLAKAIVWSMGGPLAYRGHTRAYVIGETLTSATLALAALIFVPQLGVLGVAVAHWIAYLAALVSSRAVLKSATQITVPWTVIIRTTLLSIALATLAWAIERHPALTLPIAALAGIWCATTAAPIVKQILRHKHPQSRA